MSSRQHPAGAHSTERLAGPTHLAAKLTPPNLGRHLVGRPRLTALLDDTSGASTILVGSPAGYGKSILVSQWLATIDHPSVWVTIDRFDNDADTFFSSLVEALGTIDDNIGVATRSLLAGSSVPASSFLARSLSAELCDCDQPLTLVLDDYHTVKNPGIHRALAFLLDQPIAPMRVVLISRTRPPLPFAKIRNKSGLIEIGRQDLRFGNEEAFELLHQCLGLDIDRADSDSINERAEGWVTGLSLIGHALRGRSRAQIHDEASSSLESVRSIETYLWEEVIDLQSPDVRAFLLDVSILGRFSASLCNAVRESEDAAAIIHQLERDQLFIVDVDEQRSWFRFHRFFADALLRRLTVESTQAEVFERHRRAARWFEEHSQVEEAAYHAIAGEDWDNASRLMGRVNTEQYPVDSLERLCLLFENVPIEVFERNPGLTFRYAWALTRLGRFPRADQMLLILDTIWSNGTEPENVGAFLILKAYRQLFIRPAECAAFATQAIDRLSADQTVEYAMASVLLGYGYLYSGQLAAAERAFDQTRSHLDGTRRNWVELSERAMSAFVMFRRGRLADAAELLEDALRTADEHDELGNQLALNYLGRIRIEQLQLDAAAECLWQAQELSVRRPSRLTKPLIAGSLAELAWIRGDSSLALREIERAVLLADQLPSPALRGIARALQMRMWIWSGQEMFAQRWARSSGIDPAIAFDGNRQHEYLTYVRWLIMRGEFAAASTMIGTLVRYAGEHQQDGDLIEILLLRAIIANCEGNENAAIEDLGRSLTLGKAGGFLAVFVNELDGIRPLLSHKTIEANHGAFIRQMRRPTNQSVPSPHAPRPRSSVNLSRREQDVLELVAKGLSNREIGERLYISDKTVKRHLTSIYRKLDAVNRVQAIDRARREHLLD